MRKFNLEEYLQNPWRKVVTRDGRSVRIVCTDKKGSEYPIIALIDEEYEERVLKYTKMEHIILLMKVSMTFSSI